MWKVLILWLGLVTQLGALSLHHEDVSETSGGVQMFVKDKEVQLNNDIVNVSMSTPDGLITIISYKGSDNLLDTNNTEDDRGYWDVFWGEGDPVNMDKLDKLQGTSFKVILQTREQIEISFSRTWNISVNGTYAPLNVDRRFVMLSGSSGFYTYAIFERLKGWPSNSIGEARIVFKLHPNKFHYMAMSDVRQRIMPTLKDRENGQVLEFKEAVLLTNPSNPDFKGEVDDKYFYSCDNKDNKVHGWVSNDSHVGFWMITPSNEFRNGGPFKQDLTSHVGPILLNMLASNHYAGKELNVTFEEGEAWKKVYGPVYVYLNSDPLANDSPRILWEDAKKTMEKEVASWPYEFPNSIDFLKANQRGTIRGQLLVHDWYINNESMPASNAYVGLAPPGPAGSWQTESKGYQFWTQADSEGKFLIKNVIPGTYSLYASIPGIIGDYKNVSDLFVKSGSDITLENLVYEPPRNGATIWEIGVPDRTAAEFYIPDPDPSFKIYNYSQNNKSNSSFEKFRVYGLWSRYSVLYPTNDVVFTIGTSNYTTDWFFAHVNRNVGNETYQATTWKIVFDLENINKAANYTLRLALASATRAELQVRLNDPRAEPPDFTTGEIGDENAIARHGIHGLYRLYNVDLAGSRFINGNNTIFLTQAINSGPFTEIMYDYIRLESPPQQNVI